MLAAAGTGFAEIQLYKDGSVLISASFYTKIAESANGAGTITSDSESTSFTKLLVETTQARDGAQSAKSAAEKATAAANSAATAANNAAVTANGAAGNANTATTNANNAANTATAAAKTAQDAAAAVYTDRNYNLLVGDDGAVTFMYNEQ